MNIMRLIAASLLLLLGACSKEPPMPLDVAQSKQMVWDVIKSYHEASDKDDGIDIITSLLGPEASMVMNSDDVIRGHDNVVRAIRDRIKSGGDTKRSTIIGKEVIKPEGDYAWVSYVASVQTQRGVITAICRRNKDGKWLIIHIHETWSPLNPKK